MYWKKTTTTYTHTWVPTKTIILPNQGSVFDAHFTNPTCHFHPPFSPGPGRPCVGQNAPPNVYHCTLPGRYHRCPVAPKRFPMRQKGSAGSESLRFVFPMTLVLLPRFTNTTIPWQEKDPTWQKNLTKSSPDMMMNLKTLRRSEKITKISPTTSIWQFCCWPFWGGWWNWVNPILKGYISVTSKVRESSSVTNWIAWYMGVSKIWRIPQTDGL